MNKTEYVRFEITVDTDGTPFSQDDVYNSADKCVGKVDGWENALQSKEVEMTPSATLAPEVIAILSLSVSTIGLAYNVVRNYFKDKYEKETKLRNDGLKEKEEELKKKESELRTKELEIQQQELEKLQDIEKRIQGLIKQLSRYGKVSIKLEK